MIGRTGTLLLVAASTVFCQTTLHGIVTNGAGAPIANSFVRLIALGLMDTTGADGRYSFGSVGIAASVHRSGSEGVWLSPRGVVSLALTSPTLVNIAMYNAKGCAVKNVAHGTVAGGLHRFDIGVDHMAQGWYVVRLSVGGLRLTALCIGGHFCPLSRESTVPNSGDRVLARVNASGVDSMMVSAPGYIPAHPFVQSYQSTVDVKLDSLTWRERILSGDGSINWNEYALVAGGYNQAEMIDYRFGPSSRYYHPVPETIPDLYGPKPDGIYSLHAGAWCRWDVGPDGDPGGGWMMSGQTLYVPDAGVAADYRYGCSNMRSADGAISFTDSGLCLRPRPSWQGDWWNRNQISVPGNPTVVQLYNQSNGTLPVPPVATARSVGGAAVTGYLAFRNGLITATGTGNDDYIFAPLPYPNVQLPAAKVPTAMAVTNANEFVLVTVWDTLAHKGQLGVIAVKGPLNASGGKLLYGLPGMWMAIRELKLLGFVDLPFAAPMSLDVTTSINTGNPRGNTNNAADDFNLQSVRDHWLNVPYTTAYGDDFWKQTAQSGYAIVSSRAENKVAIIDMRPLFRYYRSMYFTTQANYDQTKNVGLGANQWPFTFATASQQMPVVAKVLNIRQPTSVAAGCRWNSFKAPRSYSLEASHDDWKPLKTAYVATMDGTLQLFDVQSLIVPDANAAVPDKPFKTTIIGNNPSRLFHGFHGTASDDYYAACRGDRSIYYMYYNGFVNAVLRDGRMTDPVNVFLSMDQAGYGGSGFGKAVYVNVMTVMDFEGKRIQSYVVDDGFNNGGEQLSIVDQSGKPAIFQFVYGQPTFGKPFMCTVEEVF